MSSPAAQSCSNRRTALFGLTASVVAGLVAFLGPASAEALSSAQAPVAGLAPRAHAFAHTRVMPRHQVVSSAAAANPALTTSTEVGPITFHGGPVEHHQRTFAIYWTPTGSVTALNYRSVIEGYLGDVGGSPYFGLMGQYGDNSGPIPNSSSFSGAYMDTTAYPTGRGVAGASAAPLLDSDIQNEVTLAIAANPAWGGPTVDKQFIVFLPYGVYVTVDGLESFTSGGFCAYHSGFNSSGGPTIYDTMPYAATDPGGCTNAGPFPHASGDPSRPGDADNETNILSHEQFEAVTDPEGDGWFFPDTSAAAGQENGDICRALNGIRSSDGSNVTLNGHRYLVQTSWSNADAPVPNDTAAHGCVLASNVTAPPPTTTTMASTTSSTMVHSPFQQAIVTRLSGTDRVATAIAVASDLYPTAGSASAVVLTRSDGYADALAGTPLAVAKVGPLLMTPSGGPLDPRVDAFISRVLPAGQTVYILGGDGAVGADIEAGLASTYHVIRLSGPDRYATAVAIADVGLGNPAVQVLATGVDFPDALAGGAAAASASGAVLLTAGATMPPATANYLGAHAATRYALGGPAAAAAAADGVTPIVGSDRYDTAAQTARAFFTAPSTVGVASGTSFPDALGGGVHAAAHHGPLVLVRAGDVPVATASYLNTLHSSTVAPHAFVYGGPVVISDTAAAAIGSALST